jgi:hypothetical protein
MIFRARMMTEKREMIFRARMMTEKHAYKPTGYIQKTLFNY